MKTKHYCLAALTLFLLCMVVSSCDDDDTVTLAVPNASFYYQINAWYGTFVTNGETLEYEVTLNESNSSPNISISKVEYYWDNDLIMIAKDTKHKLSWLVKGQTLGDHDLMVKAYTGGSGYTDLISSWRHTITVVDVLPTMSYVIDYPSTISNGETFTCTVAMGESTLDIKIAKVSYYWDDELLLETSLAPYRLSYPIEKQYVGEHVLTVEVQVTGEWNGTTTYSYAVEVLN